MHASVVAREKQRRNLHVGNGSAYIFEPELACCKMPRLC